MKNTTKPFKMKSYALIAIVLMMTSIIMITVPVTKASTTDYVAGSPQQGTTSGVVGDLASGVTPSISVTTGAWLSVSPSPIGKGQTALVNMWTTPPISPMRFQSGYYVDIIRPDGTTETVGPMDSYPADATAWFQFTPDQTGTYQFKFRYTGEYFPNGTWYNGALTTLTTTSGYYLNSAYYSSASTGWQNLTVQDALVSSWPAAALPTDYWTRPVQVNNREWWPILGNYPAYGIVGGGSSWPANTNSFMSNLNFNPYVQGPNTAHIEYMQQEADAGIIGGTAGAYSISGRGATPSVIYNGRCYQTMYVAMNGTPINCAVCYDLQTGKQYYAIPISTTPGVIGGVTPNIISYTAPGASSAAVSGEQGATASGTYTVTLIAIDSSGNFYKINPWTGAVTFNMTGPAGSIYRAMSPQLLGGSQGSSAWTGFYKDPYVISIQTIGTGTNTSYRLINWTTAGTTTNFTQRIMGNVSLPWGVYTWPSGVGGASAVVADFETNIMVWMVGMSPPGLAIYHGTWMTAVNMATGQMLWNKTYPDDTRYSTACYTADHGMIAVLMEGGYYETFSETTGNPVWKSQKMDYPWGSDSFGGYSVQSAYGLLYREAYDGVYAFNWTDGSIAWHYVDPAVPFETPYTDVNGTQTYSFNGGGFVADGKLYTYNTEHTATYPITRGWGIQCINATSGAGIWKIYGTDESPAAISDGYLVASNAADGYLYVYGKGQSSTTVSAPATAVTTGTAAVISGTVLDQSPAQPNTPCVAAESMSQYMEYLHMQQPLMGLWQNTSIVGVPVSIDAVDPNGNFQHIATVTSDGTTGTFGYTWTPTIAGDYKISATFAGDDSYGSSFATTYATVSNAQATAAPVTQSPITGYATSSDLLTYIAVAVIAIIIAIAILGVLLLRKH